MEIPYLTRAVQVAPTFFFSQNVRIRMVASQKFVINPSLALLDLLE